MEIINYIKLNYDNLINTINIYGLIIFLVIVLFLLFLNKESEIRNKLLLVVIMMFSFQLTFNIIGNSNKDTKNIIYLNEVIEEVFGKNNYKEIQNNNKNKSELKSDINLLTKIK